MAKRRNAQASSSFSEILGRHLEAHGEAPATDAVPVPIANPEQKRVGKSADESYVKLTSYIRKDTHLKVKRKLLDQGGGQISDLVEKLLVQWLHES